MIHHCSHCGKSFEARRKDRQYCSKSCKQMAFIKRLETHPDYARLPYARQQGHSLGEIENGQTIKPSMAALPFDLESLKSELYNCAKAAIDSKLEEIMQQVNQMDTQRVNSDQTVNKENVNMSFINFQEEAKDLNGQETSNQPSSLDSLENGQLTDQAIISTKPSNKNNTLKQEIELLSSEHIKERSIKRSMPESETVNPNVALDAKSYVPVNCQWIQKIHAEVQKRDNEFKMSSLYMGSHENAQQIQWVNMIYCGLLECVLTVSEIKVLEWDEMAELSNALTFLTRTNYFKTLPKAYPYGREIVLLREKLKNFCIDTEGEEWVQFRLKPDTKKDLLMQRFELSMLCPKISFEEIMCAFENE